MGGALHTDAGAQVDGLVADPRFPGEGPIGRMAIGNQQHILVDEGQQTVMQLRLRQRPFACDEVEGLTRTVARHQDADLFIGNAALVGMAATAACRTRHVSGSLFRFQQI
ncbi:hypothetical protein D3C84_1122280 [compost metagenome]